MSPLPAFLTQLLLDHRSRQAPLYPPSLNSDHGPMAYLAMHGLGLGASEIEAFAVQYRQKLAPLPPPQRRLDASNWAAARGSINSYPELLAYFDGEIAARGWQATLGHYLPGLLSGWVRDAFHPLIRLGYGVEFGALSEIAAGLAYLACAGPDPRLERAMAATPESGNARQYLEALQSQRRPEFSEGRFGDRYEHVLEAKVLRPMAGDTSGSYRELSRACLEVFHACHDFFALHLVTGSHAFRICSRWAGPNALTIFQLGLAAGYLAIGAPPFEPVALLEGHVVVSELASSGDEHDIKIAFSCRAQASAYADPTYTAVAARYQLARRSGARAV